MTVEKFVSKFQGTYTLGKGRRENVSDKRAISVTLTPEHGFVVRRYYYGDLMHLVSGLHYAAMLGEVRSQYEQIIEAEEEGY